MKYFVINKSKKYNFLHSFTLKTVIFHEKSLVQIKKFPKAKQCGFSIFYSQDHHKKVYQVSFCYEFIPGFDSYLTLLSLLIRSLVSEQPNL